MADVTQADIDDLDAQIAEVQVVKSTTMADQQVVFRDLQELNAQRALLVQRLAAQAGSTRTRYASTSKGV